MTKSKNIYEHHDWRNTTTYNAWSRMRSRCTNLNWSGSDNYGKRGITFDPRWENFTAFLEDLGPMPPNTSLGRIDNNGNYSKDNCRWETREEQNRNRRLFKNSTTGIAGVTLESTGWRTRVYHNGIRQSIYKGLDFFEACCARKSWEVRYERRHG